MKCEKCNKEFSDSVFPFHIERCDQNIKSEGEEVSSTIEKVEHNEESLDEVKSYTEEEILELRAKAKEAKIHNWHSKNPNTLVKELGLNQ